MKLILSRKGFDSKNGGVPSPIFPDRSALSLPIPAKDERTTIGDLRFGDISVGNLVSQLSSGRVDSSTTVHRDPDLDKGLVERGEHWTPAFGQAGSAQGHLAKQGVGPGDIFLFFGWFRNVEQVDQEWRYVRGKPGVHALFGWLRVDEVVRVGNEVGSSADEHPDLAGHPHLHGRDLGAQNTVYKGADAGVFDQITDNRILTAPGYTRSVWQLPHGFLPLGRTPLTHHGNPARWTEVSDDIVHLRTVPIGQEFVLDFDDYPELHNWVDEIMAQE